MTTMQKLEQSIRELYEAKDPKRDEWADWLYENHIFIVGDNAERLAKRFGANPELARAAGLLHDIADVKMTRFTEEHEEASRTIARDLLQPAGYSQEDIATVVDDALRLHSCRDGKIPQTLEGKVMATADGLAHLQTDFCLHALWSHGRRKSFAEAKAWARKKIEKDFNAKMLFDEVKEECRADYEQLKAVFGR
jgi:putative nucleotidyltransferase with HDIG domain